MKKITLIAFLLITQMSFSQIASDDCAAATNISVTTSNVLSYTINFADFTESDPAFVTNCEVNASTVYIDGWWKFTMPVDGNIVISNAFSIDSFTLFDACNGTELDCGFGDEVFYNLVENTTYILRQARTTSNLGSSGFDIQAFAKVSNDDCANRETINVSTTGVTSASVDLRGATEDAPAFLTNCEIFASQDYLDVWWEFEMPVNGNIIINNTFSIDTFTLYDSCGGTEIDCGSGDEVFYDLSENTTYVLRQARRDFSANISSFDIQAFAKTSNDDCSNKETITVSTTGVTSTTVDMRGATEDDATLVTACETIASQDYLDVWWEFEMPVNGNIIINNAFSIDTFTLYDSCGGIEIDCGSGNEIFYNLSENTTYVLRQARRDFNANISSFDMQVYAVMSNDDCANKETFTVSTDAVTTLTADYRGATEDDPSFTTTCETIAGQDYLDVWWEFTMPEEGNIVISNTPSTVVFTLFSDCGGTEIDCGSGNEIFYGLQDNTTYTLRSSQRDIFASVASFDIQLVEIPENDDCSNATLIPLSSTISLNYTVDMRGASEDDAEYVNDCETNQNQDFLDVWWQFVMPVDGNVMISNTSSSQTFTLFDTCGGAEISCGSSQEFFYNLTQGSTYVLRQSQRDIFAQEASFTIQAFATGVQDECATAVALNVGVVSPVVTSVDFKIFSPSENPSASCQNAIHTYHDAFYQVTMPFDGTLEITNTNSSNLFALFEGDCDGEESCFFSAGSFFNLEGGTSYILSVARRDIFSNSAPLNFSVQAIPSPLSPCTATTTTFQNGVWDNGLPDITTNAIIRSNYNTATTLDPNGDLYGSIEACSISIDTGVTLTVASEDYLDIGFGITVNGTLNVSHQGSVVQRDPSAVTTNNGTITVAVTTPFIKPRDFMIMGSPMTAETRDGVWDASYRVFEHTTTNFQPSAAVATAFPNAENFVDEEGDDFTQFTGTIVSGEGYLVRPQASVLDGNSTYTHIHEQGTLNNGDITYAVDFNTDKVSSFNLLANPYPSAILADDFINANAMVDELYFWEHITPPSADFPGWNNVNFSMEDISTYNLMGGVAATSDVTGVDTAPNGLIATAQGFGIKANAAGTATFTNEMRRTSGNTTLRGVDENRDRLWLAIQNEAYGFKNTMLLGFTGQASEGYDVGYDSKRIPTTVSLFSHIEGVEAELAIQSREVFSSEMSIALGFSTQIDEQTVYSISIEKLEGLNLEDANTEIYLLDRITNERVHLNKEAYSFTATKGTFSQRFVLFFEEGALTTQEQWLSSLQLFPNPTTSALYLLNPTNNIINKIEIFDMLGRSVFLVKDEIKNNEVMDVSNLQAGNYMVKITSGSTSVIKRVIKK